MTHPNRVRLSKLTLGLLAALAAAPVFAQATSAGIAGRVVGADGQPVVGAEVVITHTESGTVSRAVTGADGRYNARGLRVGGPYTITTTSGAGAGSQDGVYLNLDKVNQVDVTLAGGSVTTLESVQAISYGGSEVFSATKMGAGTTVTREQLESMPTINRNIQDFARLDPRVVQSDKARNEISVGGQNPRYNVIRVDGISSADSFGLQGNGLPTPRQPFSIDTIDEIAVDVANYDVTISGAVGGVINAVTKSGTNEFHGSVYGVYRDNDWSGKNQNDIRPVLFDSEETYGATFGGPIVKDKLFFFINYENYTGKDLFTGNSGFGPVGSGESNIVGITQAQIDQVIAISQGKGFDPGTLAKPALDTESEEFGIKFDWNITDAQRATFRYGKTEQSTPFLQGFSNSSLALNTYHYVSDFELETYSAQLFSDWTDVFSTEAKVSYRDYLTERNPLTDLPAIAVRIGNNTLNFGTEENTHANVLGTKTWNAFFAGNLFLGDHTVKFGADYESNEVYNLFGRRVNGVYTFNSIADYAANRSSRYQLFYPLNGDLDAMAAVFTQKNLGLFLQDSWAVNQNLTLTYGLRYDRSIVDDKPVFNATASSLFGVRNDNTVDGADLWSPRVGFNYTMDTERPSQVRGGLGLFKGAAATVWLANPYANNGVTYTDFFDSNGTTVFSPDPNGQLAIAQTGGVPGTQSVDFIDPDLTQPSVWKTNLAFDTELPFYGIVASTELVLTSVKEGIYYQQLNLGAPTRVGQDGRLMYWNAAGYNRAAWNQAGVGTGTTARAARDLRFNDAIIAKQTTKGESQQLTFSLNKPFNDSDWAWTAAYTYTNANEVSPLTSSTSSSQLGNVSIFQANEEVSATSAYEIKNRFLATLQWKHAFFGDNDTMVSLVYEGRSGRPYTYNFDNDANGDGRINDLLYIPNGPGDVLFGSAAEEAAFWNFVAGDEYLNSHKGQVAVRNDSTAPWVNQFDLQISQELPGFWEGHKAELTLDILNVGNLINNDWGRVEEMSFPSMRGVVEYGGVDPTTGKYVYRFNTPDSLTVYDDKGISRWAGQISFRYRF
ncbi:TonB-dependent receptor [Lysobacter niastensis]|uniref:TonB-dependent receptor n=1 Tax=Lysobacter niastensis TaxID=380629 RepID=A0ABS0B2R0_9GAMM|nr:TonB-dependent receptor [Lysobacter niastensis]MBF6022761.1 TonB-dependent receptor [Lysobacter niastensis]